MGLDAQTIDVMKGATAAIFLVVALKFIITPLASNASCADRST